MDNNMKTHDIPKSKREAAEKTLPSAKKRQSCCEECEYFDYDEDEDEFNCKMSLDEDEMLRFLSGKNTNCPYYKYYDEYKSVHKQI